MGDTATQAQPVSRTDRAKPNRMKLTQLGVERLRAPTGGQAVTYWDLNLPGFGLRVSPRGRKTWVAMYRVAGGKEVMETIGTTMLIPSLADARDRARTSIDKARRGVHPVQERKKQAAAAQAEANEQAFTFEKLVEDFIRGHHERKENRPSTVYEARRLLKRASAYLGERRVREITKADILALLNDLAETRVRKWRGNTEGGSGSEANGVLRNLRKCFKWAHDNDLIDVNPVAGVIKPSAVRERKRTLSDEEITALWRVSEQVGWPMGCIVQLLLLTGQRVREVGDMPWRELDLGRRIWSLPGERTKNRESHYVPLSEFAIEIIEALPRLDQELVFPGRERANGERRPVEGYSDAKARMDRLLARELPNMKPWARTVCGCRGRLHRRRKTR